MSVAERQLRVISAYFDAFNRHEPGLLAARWAETATSEGRRHGPVAARLLNEDLCRAAPDIRAVIQEMVAAVDQVVVRSIWSGTHLGQGAILTDSERVPRLAPTGRSFSIQSIDWFTLEDGLIARHHSNRDEMSLLMQLGLLKPIPPVSLPAVPATAVEHRHVTGSAEQARNLRVINEYNSAMSRRDLDAALSYFAEDTRNHGRPVGRAGLRTVFTDIFRTYSVEDDGLSAVETIAVDDCVVARLILHHRHTGTSQIPIDGGLLMGKPPTGKSCRIQHIHWYTLRDGLIVEHRASRDDVGMMMQLGLFPDLTSGGA